MFSEFDVYVIFVNSFLITCVVIWNYYVRL